MFVFDSANKNVYINQTNQDELLSMLKNISNEILADNELKKNIFTESKEELERFRIIINKIQNSSLTEILNKILN